MGFKILVQAHTTCFLEWKKCTHDNSGPLHDIYKQRNRLNDVANVIQKDKNDKSHPAKSSALNGCCCVDTHVFVRMQAYYSTLCMGYIECVKCITTLCIFIWVPSPSRMKHWALVTLFMNTININGQKMPNKTIRKFMFVQHELVPNAILTANRMFF